MGYYIRKEKRKPRVKCCAACRRGLRGRWWWVLTFLPEAWMSVGPVIRLHPECYNEKFINGKREGFESIQHTTEYRCDADRQRLASLHSDMEVLRECYRNGESQRGAGRITANVIRQRLEQKRMESVGTGGVPETASCDRMVENAVVA